MSAIISSPANAVCKRLAALHTARGIWKYGECLVGGAKLISELIRDRPADITAWIGSPGLSPQPSIGRRLILSRERFRAIDPFGAPAPLLTVRLPAVPDFDPQKPWPDGCTLFIPFSDPENVGAAIRAAAGLGAARVILLKEAACPFLPRSVRASAGAVWRIPLEWGPPLAELAGIRYPASGIRHQAEGIPLIWMDSRGAPLQKIAWPRQFGLIPGLEGQGLPAGIPPGALRAGIAMRNSVESLNAAGAVAVALWAWNQSHDQF